jgi:hypothetical protein
MSDADDPKLSSEDLRFIREAAEYLERPTFLTRVANLVGKPAEAVLQLLPSPAQNAIGEAASTALTRGLDWAVRTLPAEPGEGLIVSKQRSRARDLLDRHLHTAVAATTGAVGGFFGVAGMSVEVPTTTMVMLRSIAQIAAQNGAELDDPLTRLHCLSVFSLGSSPLDTMESAYLTSRLGMAMALKEAAAFFARHSAAEISQALSRGTAPVLVRLVNMIAARFQVVLTQKFAAQAVPVAGAATGALINAAFTDHFNRVARYHFGIVRMERQFGKDVVQAAYRKASDAQHALREHRVRTSDA